MHQKRDAVLNENSDEPSEHYQGGDLGECPLATTPRVPNFSNCMIATLGLGSSFVGAWGAGGVCRCSSERGVSTKGGSVERPVQVPPALPPCQSTQITLIISNTTNSPAAAIRPIRKSRSG